MSVINLTKNSFKNEVTASDKPVLIDFFATWCGPCMMVSPIVDEIAAENSGYKVCKVNVDEEPELAEAFGIANIPTLVVMKNGEISGQAVGVKSKEFILSMLAG